MNEQASPTPLPDWQTSRLSSATRRGCTLQESLADWRESLKGAHALVYTPNKARFARLVENANLEYAPGEEVQESEVFELRAFNQAIEMRWRKNALGAGDAVALYEDGAVTPPGTWTPGEPRDTCALDGRYLILGNTGKFTPEGDWIRVKDFRVDDFHIPGPLGNGTRPAIAYREYFIAEEAHGNLQFLAERLTGLTKHTSAE